MELIDRDRAGRSAAIPTIPVREPGPPPFPGIFTRLELLPARRGRSALRQGNGARSPVEDPGSPVEDPGRPA
ncbi:MAG: hypothetical protein ACREC5_06575 [Thermoplasmata archaeon]